MTVVAAACAVGRLSSEGPWIGFVPTLEDGYALVIGDDERVTAVGPRATPDDLLALAIAYFADELDTPPERLAATHGDIGALVRHAAGTPETTDRAAALGEAVDAIDDGLGADVVVARLSRCLESDEDPAARLRRRTSELLARSGR